MSPVLAAYLWVRRIALYFLGQRWVRFGIVGVAATGAYLVPALAFEHYGIPVLVGNALAYVIGFVVSYLGHHYWTFQSKASHASALPKFAATQTFGLGLNTGIIWVLMRVGVPYAISMLAAIVAVPVVVFVISKFWVFKAPTSATTSTPNPPAHSPNDPSTAPEVK